MPKKIYFIRHGESQQIASKTNQDDTTPLSQVGLRQADAVAKRFVNLEIHKLYSSPFTRALQTADALSKVLELPVITEPLLAEGRRPSFFAGKSFEDSEVIRIRGLLDEHRNDPAWHHSDEENLYDLRDRMIQVKNFLEKDSAEHLAVVCHSGVLKMLSLVLIFEDLVTPDLFMASYHRTKITQTGITMFEYKDNQWKLLTWNDYAHLADA